MDLQTPESHTNKRSTTMTAKVQTLKGMIWKQFKRHRMAMAGLYVIGFFILTALFAPVIAYILNLDPNSQNPMNRYAPAMSDVRATASAKEIAVENFIRANPEDARTLGAAILKLGFVPATISADEALYEWVIKDAKELNIEAKQLTGPGAKEFKSLVSKFDNFHILGTDELGRDVLMRIIYGTRVSIGVGILVALASALVGLLIGAFAGFYGGWIDTALMRFTDSLLSLPQLPVLIVISAVSLEKIVDIFPFLGFFVTSANESIVKLVFILVLFSWMQVARLVRASILSLKERDFTTAAIALGARDRRIIFKHLFPNAIAPLLVSVTLGVGSSIQAEAALSFLGLGIQQPTPSWGNMMFNAIEIMAEAPILVMVPGLLILATTISFNYLGDGLQDAIDPKTIRR